MGSFSVGSDGVRLSNPHIDSQTGSIFAATRSVAFVGDRIVLVSNTGTRNVPGKQAPQSVYEILSLEIASGIIKDRREIETSGSVQVFGTNDAHVIIGTSPVLRLTQDLKDDGVFDYHATGNKYGKIENISPNGSTLGNKTSPGFELVDVRNLKATQLTASPSVATSVSSKGFLTDNIHWTGQFPKDVGFVTYVDASGQHLLYHGPCGGRPQFLTDNLLLEPGCKTGPIILDTNGQLIKTLDLKSNFSYAGVSQNGKRLALQVGDFSSDGSLRKERFIIYSIDTWEPLAEVSPGQTADGQSWTAFSPDGSMFVVGSPLKLTLYRLP
ncbi:MAG TPA: hypothetical protein VKT53_08295 [Candidatus Acidoferrum sp.]|nr:hypothetical protein [Candidatus Acidoferrum sp.]